MVATTATDATTSTVATTAITDKVAATATIATTAITAKAATTALYSRDVAKRNVNRRLPIENGPDSFITQHGIVAVLSGLQSYARLLGQMVAC